MSPLRSGGGVSLNRPGANSNRHDLQIPGYGHEIPQKTGISPLDHRNPAANARPYECPGTETTGRMAGHAEDVRSHRRTETSVSAPHRDDREGGRGGGGGGHNHAFPPGRHTVRMFACDPAGRALCGAFRGPSKWVPRHLTHSARWHRTEQRTSNL